MRLLLSLSLNGLYPVQHLGRRTKPKGVSIMFLPTRMFLPVMTAAILIVTTAASAFADDLPEPRCGVDRVAAMSTLNLEPAMPAYDAACEVTVYFETGNANLCPEARRALDQAAPEIITHLAWGGRARVDGYASVAFAEETEALSRRRAQAVAAYLEAAWGIPSRWLELRGYGSVLADGRDPPRTAENRRATLVLDAGLPAVARVRRSWPTVPRTDHLDLDDFGGARNPLAGPLVRIWTAPRPRHD